MSSFTVSKDLFSILQLIRTPFIGPLTFYDLITKFGSAAEVIKNWNLVAEKLRKKTTLVSVNSITTEIKNMSHFGGSFLGYTDPLFPVLLKEIPDCPPVICVKGNLDLLKSKKTLAIVGARNASAHGRRLGYSIAKAIGQEGWTCISGLARGIDTAAHEGSLDTGTIAVLAGGIDHIYPEENKKLYEKIAQCGVILSEAAFGTQPQAPLFPRRNRIISGLSRGTLVVEAAFQSGSLITAKCAADQGRDVFAVPGSPLDPRCKGTNYLLKQGATLTESASDILNILAFQVEHIVPKKTNSKIPQNSFNFSLAPTSPSLNKTSSLVEGSNKILEFLSSVPVSMDSIVQELNMSTAQLSSLLLDLEMDGKIERHPDGNISRILL